MDATILLQHELLGMTSLILMSKLLIPLLCVNRGYIYLLLITVLPCMKHSGEDKLFTPSDVQEADQHFMHHGNLVPFYHNGYDYCMKVYSTVQLCSDYISFMMLCFLRHFRHVYSDIHSRTCASIVNLIVYMTLVAFVLQQCTCIPTDGNNDKQSCKRNCHSDASNNSNIPPQESSQHSHRKRHHNAHDLDKENPPPAKQARGAKYNSEDLCRPCEVWVQLGKEMQFISNHEIKLKARRAGASAVQFSKYLSVNGKTFCLLEDSCMCNACYMDASRNVSTSKEPRWVSVHAFRPRKVDKHCPVCHDETKMVLHECSCKNVAVWHQPSTWMCGLTENVWQQYFHLTRDNFHAVIRPTSLLCKRHSMEIYHHVQKRICAVCSTNVSENWGFIGSCSETTIRSLTDEITTGNSRQTSMCNTDWICETCKKKSSRKVAHEKATKDMSERISYTLYMHKAIDDALLSIKNGGFMLRIEIFNNFVKLCPSEMKPAEYKVTFDHLLDYKLVHCCELVSLTNAKTLNTLVYNKHLMTDGIVHQVFDVINENHSLRHQLTQHQQSVKWSEKELQGMVDQQVQLFKSAETNYDFRDLLSKVCENKSDCIEEQYLLGKYLHKPLLTVFERILGIDKSEGITSAHLHKQKIKLQTAISIMCNIRSKKSIMMQTILGLVGYATGLRDKGFKILNMFGVTCSIDHIRREASKWSEMRKCIEEVDKNAFWRVTFDNLNFKRKFAKTFKSAGEVTGRMLNLLTGQISHTTAKINITSESSDVLQDKTATVTDEDFTVQPNSHEQLAYSTFISNAYKTTLPVLGESPLANKSTLFHRLQQLSQHNTPKTPDNVVYATVSEAQSSSIEDVANYLNKMKGDLHIGEHGYPEKVVLGGDQQTYAILKNLIKKYPSTFAWIFPVPGDWHLLKCAAETIRDMIWDGGLSELAKLCKHMKEVTQWKDIHILLSALHESLFHEAVEQYEQLENQNVHFEKWIRNNISDTNDTSDQISKFWFQTLHFLNGYMGYFMAIRSGNFHLRMACLPILTELFFAYSHNKYAELCCSTIYDIAHASSNIKSRFVDGEWTISLSGKQFRNVALDEGHEMVINKRLKELTSRPSEYRTVTLANFMAYLDKCMQLLGKHLNKFQKDSSQTTQNKVYEYSEVILGCVREKKLFSSKLDNRPLHNVFKEKPKPLDSDCINDLLAVHSTGCSRMMAYIKHKFMDFPTENTKQTVRPRKLRTFTKAKKTPRSAKSQLGKVTLLLKRAYAQIQKTGSYFARTVEYPLALCTEFGDMRERHKSKIKDILKNMDAFKDMFVNKLPFSMSNQSTEVVIDFLRYLHSPPPPDVHTFKGLADYMWDNVVRKLGFARGATVVTVVFDKENYLPPVRNILHQERKEKSGNISNKSEVLVINDSSQLAHGTEYVQSLQCPQFKRKIIQYICEKFTEIAMVTGQTLILDCSAYDIPMVISEKKCTYELRRKNNKGEADCGVWLHAYMSPCEQIVICANDTDIWMYGLGLLERHQFVSASKNAKAICAELVYGVEYVSLNTGMYLLSTHPCLQRLNKCRIAASSILAIYLASGSDYISSFYGISIKQFLQTFMKYVDHISPDNDMFIYESTATMLLVSDTSYKRLICCAYLDKYSKFFKHIRATPPELFSLLKISSGQISTDVQELLEWAGYDTKKETVSIDNVSMWCEFTRRLCYFSNQGSQHLFKQIPPSDSALCLHISRVYVLNLAIQSIIPITDLYTKYKEFGWKESVSGNVEIIWEDNIDTIKKELSSKRKPPIHKCTCMAKENRCSGQARGCTNCYRACRPCTDSCKCKAQCSNSHNNGGSCPRCSDTSIALNPPQQECNFTTDASDNDTNSGESDIEDGENMDVTESNEQEFSDYGLYFSDDNNYYDLPEQFSMVEVDKVLNQHEHEFL